MAVDYSNDDKDVILINAFNSLKTLNIKTAWSMSLNPYSDLLEECNLLMADTSFVEEFETYLENHLILISSVGMLFTYIAMSSRSKWHDVPDDIRTVTARGWFLGRWIPTFLIIDGPIGRFLCKGGSPLNGKLKVEHAKYPLLASARDFLNNDIFRKLRNGFGHWAFDWESDGKDSFIVSFDWNDGQVTAKMHQRVADAFHIVAFGLVEILFETMINRKGVV